MTGNQPYSNAFHPYKSWLDKLLQLFFFNKLNQIIDLPWRYTEHDSDKVLKNGIDEIRDGQLKNEKAMIDNILKKNLLGYTKKDVFIPRNDDVLKSYCDYPMDNMPKSNKDDDKVKVTILCPNDLQEKIFPGNTETAFHFHDVDASVPIIVYFHGGGFIMGNSFDLYTATLFDKLLTTQQEKEKTKTKPDAILVSVEYRLAPENPFPCGVIDSLSVMEHIFSSTCSPDARKFHLAGSSAGANYCTMVTMERLRRFSDHRISSAFIDIPFLDPKADSLSYYKNSESTIVPFLVWCWRSYLSSECAGDNDSSNDFSNNTTQAQQSKWMKDDTMIRFIYPTVGIPPARNDDNGNNAINFIVVTSLADPLHDEGVELVNKMEEMGFTNLKHFETMSSHATYNFCDRSMARRIFNTWSSDVFQNTSR